MSTIDSPPGELYSSSFVINSVATVVLKLTPMSEPKTETCWTVAIYGLWPRQIWERAEKRHFPLITNASTIDFSPPPWPPPERMLNSVDRDEKRHFGNTNAESDLDTFTSTIDFSPPPWPPPERMLNSADRDEKRHFRNTNAESDLDTFF